MQAVIQSNPRMSISGKTLLLTANATARVKSFCFVQLCSPVFLYCGLRLAQQESRKPKSMAKN